MRMLGFDAKETAEKNRADARERGGEYLFWGIFLVVFLGSFRVVLWPALCLATFGAALVAYSYRGSNAHSSTEASGLTGLLHELRSNYAASGGGSSESF